MHTITPKEVASAITTQKAAPVRQPDTQVEPVAPAPTETPKADSQEEILARLAKKESALAKKWKELEAKEASQKVDEPALQSKFKATFEETLKQRIAEDPLGFMQEHGYDTDKLTELILNPPAPLSPEVKAMRAKLEALEQQLESGTKAQEEQRSQAYNKAVEQIRNDVTSLVDTDEKFQTVKELQLHEAVVELIKQTFDSTGKLMSLEDAANEVEEYALNEALRVANLQKVQTKLKPQDPIPPVKGSATPTTTLTNRLEQEAPSRPLTSKQRQENAIAIAEGREKPHK